MRTLTFDEVDRLMSALDKLDAYLENLDTARKPRTRTKVVYRDPPDPKAVDLAELADSINRRLTLLEATGVLGAGRAVQDGLDPERLARAYAEFVRQGGDWPKWDEIDDFDKDGLRAEAQEIAVYYRAAPPPASESQDE